MNVIGRREPRNQLSIVITRGTVSLWTGSISVEMLSVLGKFFLSPNYADIVFKSHILTMTMIRINLELSNNDEKTEIVNFNLKLYINKPFAI